MLMGQGVLYTFLPFTAEDGALSMDVRELTSDDEALAHAGRLLVAHTSAATVQVYEGDREIGAVVAAQPSPPHLPSEVAPSH